MGTDSLTHSKQGQEKLAMTPHEWMVSFPIKNQGSPKVLSLLYLNIKNPITANGGSKFLAESWKDLKKTPKTGKVKKVLRKAEKKTSRKCHLYVTETRKNWETWWKPETQFKICGN